MRVARALVVSSLIPLLGVAAVGIGAGYRSVLELGQFVLMWAVVLCPLVAVLTLSFYFLSRWRGLTARWHFAVAGVVGGATLAFSWGPLQPANGSSPVLPTLVFCVVAAALGAATTVLFWRLVVGTRAA